MAVPRALTRSRDNAMIFGVCGGIAEYFGWDVTLARLVFLAVSIISAAVPGVLLYLAAAIIMPPADVK